MKFTSKTWKAGSSGTLSIVIGKNIREHYNIEEGDLVELDLIQVFKGKKEEDNAHMSEKVAPSKADGENKKSVQIGLSTKVNNGKAVAVQEDTPSVKEKKRFEVK